MDNKIKVLHLRSDAVNKISLYDIEDFIVEAKRPSADDLDEGAIAINYSPEDELIMIKNSDGEIVAFVSEKSFNDLVDIMVNLSVSFDLRIENIKEYTIKEKAEEVLSPTIKQIEYVTADAIRYLNDKVNNIKNFPNIIDGGDY